VRGGLDDALDKLARRDELRRRAAGEATGTPPAIQELAEAIASVVSRNPKLAVTVGVEGAGDPVLLHFLVEDGVVQVNVDNSVASRVADNGLAAAKHADFDIVVGEPDVAFASTPAQAPEAGEDTRRISYDDRDRYDPGTGYSTSTYGDQSSTTAPPAYSADAFYPDSAAADRRYEGHRRYDNDFTSPGFFPTHNGGTAPRESAFPTSDNASPAPHPLAATPPPPLPPQTSRPTHAEQHRAPDEVAAAQRAAERAAERTPGQSAPPSRPTQPGQSPQPGGSSRSGQPSQSGQSAQSGQSGQYGQSAQSRPSGQSGQFGEPGQAGQFGDNDQFVPQPLPQPAQPPQRGMPTPLPKPIPLKLDSEETELAAKRLAALLRDNPSLLHQSPPD
jgi:hypothetical protein